MIVGLLTLDIAILEARSLKDKRRVVQGLKQKLQHRFHASVAEVDYQNVPKRSLLGVAMVSSQSRRLHSQLDKIVDFVRRTGTLSLLEYRREFF